MRTLRDQLREDLALARKSRDAALTLVLGTVLAEVENQQLALTRPIEDADVIEVVRRAIKKRKEAEDAFVRGNRPELAERERVEATSLQRYVPAAVEEAELRSAVETAVASGATSLGAVMAAVMPRFKGRADGAVLSRLAREALGITP